MKHLVSLLVILCLTSFVYAGGNGQGASIHTLVIDPGHGGLDPGAIGPGGHHEAELALGVSLKFGEMVHKMFPDIKIIYTRTTDKFVSLADRAEIANKAKADLFICIHLNSATNHDAYGTSTYVLGLHRTDDNLEIAKRENAVIELEGDKDKNYEFDPNSPEGHIIMSMKQNAFLDQSILIASKIEDELALLSKRKSRGVKQAGFWVLYKTAMPSLLAEIGFISNPMEETYLSSADGQTNIATSIAKAFSAYKYHIEGSVDTSTEEGKIAFQKKTEKQADSAALKALQNPHPAQAVTENKAPKAVEAPKPVAVAEVKPKAAEPAKPIVAEIKAKAAEPAKAPPVAEETKPKAPVTEKPKPAPSNPPAKQEEKAIAKNDAPKAKSAEEAKPAIITDGDQAKMNELRMMNEARHRHDSLVAALNKGKMKDTTPVDPNIKFTPINQVATNTATETPKPAKEATPEKKQVVVGTTTQPKAKADTVAKKPANEEHKVVKVDTKTTTTSMLAKKEEPAKEAKKEEPKVVKTETKETKATTTTSTVKKEETKTTKPLAETQTATPVVKETVKTTAKADDNVNFNVQLIAGLRKPANYKDLVSSFGVLRMEEIQGGVIRYMAGPYATAKEAEKALATAKKFGYEDAFVIAYQDGKRTTPQKTRDLVKVHP